MTKSPRPARTRKPLASTKVAAPKSQYHQAPPKAATKDSFANVEAKLGINQQNLLAGGTYELNPITRDRLKLEWAYRGSWICRAVVESVADDMTRAGIDIDSSLAPDQIEQIAKAMQDLGIMKAFNELGKWARLYGGAVAVMLIDGQDMSTPLNLDSIRKGQFKGLYVMDRWMIQPDWSNPISILGPDLGRPSSYQVFAATGGLPGGLIHHSRVVRAEGVDLPYFQRITENGWGLSVLEPMWDRLIAFDSATTGAAQLVFKAHVRSLKMKGLRKAIAGSEAMLQEVVKNIDFIRRFQSTESLTLLDLDDVMENHDYTFSGLSDVLLRLAEQLCGATGIPSMRLFGDEPSGLNADGSGTLRGYFDMILARQESEYRPGMGKVLDAMHRSELGIPPEDGFAFRFRPLWQLDETEKATIAGTVATAVSSVFEQGIIDRPTAMKELRESSRTTGIFTNVTDDAIKEAEDDPPEPSGLSPKELEAEAKAATADPAGKEELPAQEPAVAA